LSSVNRVNSEREQAVDGVIILSRGMLAGLSGVLLPDGLPVVVVDSSVHYDYPIVDTDQV
jgi:DNA-binding LacI/PurR family transcriptional regulator